MSWLQQQMIFLVLAMFCVGIFSTWEVPTSSAAPAWGEGEENSSELWVENPIYKQPVPPIAPFAKLPTDVVALISGQLSGQDFFNAALSDKKFAEGARRTELSKSYRALTRAWPGYARFRKRFFKIPAGYLPTGDFIPSFYGSKPVTRRLYATVMEAFTNEPIPIQAFSTYTAKKWNSCPNCPVTHVAYEEDASQKHAPGEIQIFLQHLNFLTRKIGCQYQIPTEAQLWYKKRGDVTGRKYARYGMRESWLFGPVEIGFLSSWEYIRAAENSENRLWPVGSMLPNAFGDDLGNIWEISQTDFDPFDSSQGKAIRGGSFLSPHSLAKTKKRAAFPPGQRWAVAGFSLVEECGLPIPKD